MTCQFEKINSDYVKNKVQPSVDCFRSLILIVICCSHSGNNFFILILSYTLFVSCSPPFTPAFASMSSKPIHLYTTLSTCCVWRINLSGNVALLALLLAVYWLR